MNLSFLTPMLDKASEKIVFMDFESGNIYRLTAEKNDSEEVIGIGLEKVDEDLNKAYFADFQQKQKSIKVNVPYEQIHKVLNTEKDLSEQSSKHIFRRQF